MMETTETKYRYTAEIRGIVGATSSDVARKKVTAHMDTFREVDGVKMEKIKISKLREAHLAPMKGSKGRVVVDNNAYEYVLHSNGVVVADSIEAAREKVYKHIDTYRETKDIEVRESSAKIHAAADESINQAVNKLLGEAEEESLYHKLLEIVENMKVKDAPRGAMDFIDFLAQIYNGGLLQYVQNGYAENFGKVATFVRQYGGEAADELISRYKRLDPEPTIKTLEDIGEEGDVEAPLESWEEFNTWLYDKKNTDPILQHIIDKLQEKAKADA